MTRNGTNSSKDVKFDRVKAISSKDVKFDRVKAIGSIHVKFDLMKAISLNVILIFFAQKFRRGQGFCDSPVLKTNLSYTHLVITNCSLSNLSSCSIDKNLKAQVSISSTINACLFCTQIFCAAFLYLHFGFEIF